MMSIFTKLIALVLSSLAALTMQGSVTFSPVDKDNIKLNFSVISDTHIATLSEDARGVIFAKGLKDMAKAETKSDALIICGDMTERGTAYEYDKLGGVLKAFCKTDNLLPEMGNHDIRGIAFIGELRQSYETGAARYRAFLAETAGITADTVYYYRIIKGCYFIVLNTEALDDMEAVISVAQINWLDSLLAQAAGSGKPVFVFNHQPMRSIGDDAPAIMSVLQKYKGLADIFFISGHKHNGFSADTITNDGTLYFVDMPTFGKVPDGDYNKPGSGFQVELYENEIIFRARNFADGVWVPEFDRTIDLIDKL